MKKGFLLKVTVAVLALLIVFTLISKSVYSAKLPVVTFTSAGEKNVEHSMTVVGELYYADAAQVTLPGSFEVTEVFVEKGMTVKRGDALFAVDVSAKELEKASLDLELLRNEHSFSSLDLTLESLTREEDRPKFLDVQQEYELQRDILQRRLDALTASYPEGGIVRAETAGIVDRVQVKPGGWTQAGQICVETHTADAPIWARYSLSGEDAELFQVPDNSRIVVQSILKDENTGNDMLTMENLSVRERRNVYDEETGRMNVSIRLSEPVGIPVMSMGAQVNMLEGIFQSYKGVLPLYCIHRDAEGDYIMVVQQRKSLFGIENYVTRTSVRVADRNELYAAIDGGARNQVVATSTQPLFDGDVVVVERP